MQILEKPLPGLDRLQTARVIAFFSDQTCGESCWNAKEETCRCECGGKNHGIHLRGENAVRACRILGYRYELIAIGKHAEMMEQGARLTAEDWLAAGKTKAREYYGDQTDRVACTREDFFWIDGGVEHPKGYIEMHNLKGAGSLYAVKYATLAQCIKWSELEPYQIADDRDRYTASIGLLWKRSDLQIPAG